MAEKPNVMMMSFKKGMLATVSLLCVVGLPDSHLLKAINTKKATLQMRVNFEKNESTFIN